MKRWFSFKGLTQAFALSLAFLLASCGSSLSHLERPGQPENYNHYLQSTVAIVNFTSSGNMFGPTCTAFFISPRRLGTAQHCVEDPGIRMVEILPGVAVPVDSEEREETVGRIIHFISAEEEASWRAEHREGSDPEHHSARVVAADEENDVAILELVDEEEDWEHWLTMRDLTQEPVMVGEQMFAISNPVGTSFMLSTGIVSRISLTDTKVRIHHQVRLGPGSSGSALLDRHGRIVGINVSGTRGMIIITAIPISYLQTQLRVLETQQQIQQLDEEAGNQEG